MSDTPVLDPTPSGDAEPGFDLGPEPTAKTAATPYRVLARKYRPANFDDLIGQEAMVRTLSNAFDLGRIHQAYILTGVRGVGKTTTARILARAFNYEVPDAPGKPGVHRPTIHMPILGEHCQAIIESRHVDVIEMDAASHTGIDDIREIIESARYLPVSARTKVYIIDEVHMLSKAAFNGLLKTLEEPPEHVKFLFATTEIEKVPVTVRSRCQRFDLKRVEPDVLIKHLANICAKEGVDIEPEALSLIARAAEGSVRDSLSLTDQAIAHGAMMGGKIDAESVRHMLGLADRGRVIDLFEALMKGDMAVALNGLKAQYDLGADPGQVLADLAEFVHFVTRLKLVPDAAQDPSVTPDERDRGGAFAKSLSMAVLTRAWQMLLKGLSDVKESPRPLAAADMVLVRIAYAADLPPPDDVLRKLQAGGAIAAAPAAAMPSLPPRGTSASAAAAPAYNLRPQAKAAAEPVAAGPRLNTLRDVIALCEKHRDIQLKIAIERDMRLIHFEHGRIDFELSPGGSPQLAQTLMRTLQDWTGTRWMIAISKGNAAPSMREVAEEAERKKLTGVRADPLVRSVLEQFPGAEIVAVRSIVPEAPAEPEPFDPPPQGDDEVSYGDTFYTEDDL